MHQTKDPMGAAIADYHRNGKAQRLRVFSPDFDEDEIPVDTLFRSLTQMPPLEQKALHLAEGNILDVGAGAGCHSLALQEMGKRVTAIDISPLSVHTMHERGIKEVLEQDFFTLEGRYDTILMLMNGIGIVGAAKNLPSFFAHIDTLLAPGGQLLFDSSDIAYLFAPEDDEPSDTDWMPDTDGYYGELTYQMQYGSVLGEPFPWLYIDFNSVSEIAALCGFHAEMIAEGEHYDYLARITRKHD